MDQKDPKARSHGICNVLYNFIARSLATYALKAVTLGYPADLSPASAPVSGAVQKVASSNTYQLVHPMAQETRSLILGLQEKAEPEQAKSSSNDHNKDHVELPKVQDTGPEKKKEYGAQLTPKALQAQAPKKMVSMTETVKEIKLSKKKS